MRRRHIIVLIFCLCTILLGTFIFLDEASRDILRRNQAIIPKETPTPKVWQPLLSSLVFLADTTSQLWHHLGGSSYLAIYGTIALVGILLAGLAIRTGRRIAREESEARTRFLLKDLAQEKEKAEDLAKVRSEFLGHISHDLRTPLAVILGYLECLLDGLYGKIDGEHREILEVTCKQALDLKSMVDRILVFSRLQDGKSHIRTEEFSMSSILRDLQEAHDFLARQKGIRITWDSPEEIPSLRSDPDKVKEILSNLVQNAVKYTDEGSVVVRVRYLSNTDSIALEVIDTGMGIPKNLLATIFDPFVQVNQEGPSKLRGGIGLGLCIVKKHVEQLQGTINVESQLGNGTTFTATLPRVHREEQEAYAYDR